MLCRRPLGPAPRGPSTCAPRLDRRAAPVDCRSDGSGRRTSGTGSARLTTITLTTTPSTPRTGTRGESARAPRLAGPAGTADCRSERLRNCVAEPDLPGVAMAHGTHDFDDDPRNADVLSGSTASYCPRPGRGLGVRLRLRAWRRRLGGAADHGGHPAFLEQHLDRLYEGAARSCSTSGSTRDDLTAGSTARSRQRHDRRRARAADGDSRPKSTPYQDPRMTVGPGHRRHHRRAQGAAAGDRRAAACRCSPSTCGGGARHPRPEAQLAQQAQRHHRVHPGLHRRRRRGADARPARLRRDLQLDALLRRAARRGVDVRPATTASAASPGQRAEVCRDDGIPARERTSA